MDEFLNFLSKEDGECLDYEWHKPIQQIPLSTNFVASEACTVNRVKDHPDWKINWLPRRLKIIIYLYLKRKWVSDKSNHEQIPMKGGYIFGGNIIAHPSVILHEYSKFEYKDE